jgi:hypothetical protein
LPLIYFDLLDTLVPETWNFLTGKINFDWCALSSSGSSSKKKKEKKFLNMPFISVERFMAGGTGMQQ